MDWIKQRLDWERYPRPAVSNFADATLRERFLPKTWFNALTDDQIAAVASYIPQSRGNKLGDLSPDQAASLQIPNPAPNMGCAAEGTSPSRWRRKLQAACRCSAGSLQGPFRRLTAAQKSTMEIRKKFFALALENGFDFSNSLFAASGGAGRRLRVRQAEPGARKVPSHGVLRSFVSNLLFGGLGYEDLRLCSAVAFDHRLRSPVRSP